MRTPLLSFLALLLLPNLLLAADVEYGHLDELKGVERVNVWTDKDPVLRADVERQILEAIPVLTILETDKEAQIVIAVKRRVAKEDSPDPEKRFVTTGSVIRPLSETRIRLITDLVSTKENLTDATAEVTSAFVNLLKSQNSQRYGKPDAGMKLDRRQFRSLAGVRLGVSRAEVLKAIGPPTRIEGKGSTMPIWFYETTDGTFRVVFRLDIVFDARLIPAKPK